MKAIPKTFQIQIKDPETNQKFELNRNTNQVVLSPDSLNSSRFEALKDAKIQEMKKAKSAKTEAFLRKVNSVLSREKLGMRQVPD